MVTNRRNDFWGKFQLGLVRQMAPIAFYKTIKQALFILNVACQNKKMLQFSYQVSLFV